VAAPSDYPLAAQRRPVDLTPCPPLRATEIIRASTKARSSRFRAARLATCLLAWSCANPERTRGTPAPPEAAPAAARPPLSGTTARIPEGSFESGTEPGRHARNPQLEPKTKRLALGPFAIDIEPFRGDSGAFSLGLSRNAALDRCRERGARLCTELEWERACKGPAGSAFAGSTQGGQCETNPDACASGFGVRWMGQLREWTASDVDGDSSKGAIVRGAAPADPADHRRCSHRSVATDATPSDIGFRCCEGPPNAPKVDTPRLGPTFTQIELAVARLGELLAADERTRGLSRELAYFTEPEASRAVLDKGPGDTKGFLLTTSPLLWNPVAGADFLVVTARSGKSTSFVAAFYVLGDDRYRLASSFVMQDEPGPVALAYNGYIRPRLHFSTCWGCPGETGKILYRDPDQTVILQP